jgi:chemotaxis signal transduction protein
VPLSPSDLTVLRRREVRARLSNSSWAVDVRRLLSGSACQRSSPGIRLDWVSSDSRRRVALAVDAVDEIVNLPHAVLQPLPLVPRRVLSLCDGVLRDADGTYRISVRLDATWPMNEYPARRLWAEALVIFAKDAV